MDQKTKDKFCAEFGVVPVMEGSEVLNITVSVETMVTPEMLDEFEAPQVLEMLRAELTRSFSVWFDEGWKNFVAEKTVVNGGTWPVVEQ